MSADDYYAANRTPEESARMVEKVRSHFASARARGELPGQQTPDEALTELEEDNRAGRTVRVDVRCSPDEKLRWGRAAYASGMTVSALMRSAMAEACAAVEEPSGV